MATDGSDRSSSAWPASKFAFEVQCDSAVMHFQQVSGLDMESEVVEYRNGNRPAFQAIRLPGMGHFGDVTLKHGVVQGDARLWAWIHPTTGAAIQRKPLTIRLLDEGGTAVMVWTLTNAWPRKFSGNRLGAPGQEVAVESLVIAHEGVTIHQA